MRKVAEEENARPPPPDAQQKKVSVVSSQCPSKSLHHHLHLTQPLEQVAAEDALLQSKGLVMVEAVAEGAALEVLVDGGTQVCGVPCASHNRTMARPLSARLSKSKQSTRVPCCNPIESRHVGALRCWSVARRRRRNTRQRRQQRQSWSRRGGWTQRSLRKRRWRRQQCTSRCLQLPRTPWS
jgi:hypothetical protein